MIIAARGPQLGGRSTWRTELRRSLRAVALCGAALLWCQSGRAATFTVYTNRAAFEAAVAGVVSSEDFSVFPSAGTPIALTSGSINNGALQDEGLPRVFTPSNTANLFRFVPNALAFGADWDLSPGGAGNGLLLSAIFGDGSTQQIGTILNPQPNPYVGFWGFTSDVPVAALRYQSASLTGNSETFLVDNAGVKAAFQKALALSFDNIPNNSVIDNWYQAPLGVTLLNPLGGSVYAAQWASAISAPNVVSLFSSGAPAFDARSGAVDVVLSSDVSTVSIDTYGVAPLEGLGSQTKKPFLEAYNVSNQLIGQVHYSGPQPVIPGGYSPRETLTITVPGNTIHKARFSSQFSVGAVPTYGVFDNFAFAAAAKANLVDTFDGEGAAAVAYIGFANWKVTRGSVDLVSQGAFGLSCFNNSGDCVDLDGNSNIAARLESRVSYQLNPGDYTLSFALSGNQRGAAADSVTVSLGNTSQSLYSETFTLASSAPWQTYTRTITVATATTAKLIIDHAGGFGSSDNIGILLDEVKLNPVATASRAAPALPRGSVWVLAALLAFAGGWLHRRRAGAELIQVMR